MLSSTENVPCELSMERVEHLVMQINLKSASLQRHVASDSQNTGASFRESCAASSTSEVKSQLLPRREGSMGGASNSVSLQSTDSLKPRSATYWCERELFVAAAELCQYLNGGVDYRALCIHYQHVMEIVLLLLQEDLHMVREMDILPGGTIDHIFAALSGLFREGKQLLSDNGIINGESRARQYPISRSNVVPRDSTSEQRSTMVDSRFPSTTDSSGRRSLKREVQVVLENNGGSPGAEKECKRSFSYNCGDALTCDASEPGGSVETPKDEGICHARSIGEGDNTQPTTSKSNGGLLKVKVPEEDTKTPSQRMEELYNIYWKSNGIDMLGDMMQLVFLKEYEQNGSEARVKKQFLRFKKDLVERTFLSAKEYGKFKSCTLDRFELRSDYIVNCLHHYVKPNEKVLDLFAAHSVCRETSSLGFSHMQLGDADVKTIAPLFSQLPRVLLVDLSSNDIHDSGVVDLCAGVIKHPTLEALDLSNNPLTDAAAEALLHLATENPRLKVVGRQGIIFSKPAQEALTKRLQLNRSLTTPQWLPSGVIGKDSGIDCKNSRGISPGLRLTPIATPRSIRREHHVIPLRRESSSGVISPLGSTLTPVFPQSLGVVQSVRLPYRTAQLGNSREARHDTRGSSN